MKKSVSLGQMLENYSTTFMIVLHVVVAIFTVFNILVFGIYDPSPYGGRTVGVVVAAIATGLTCLIPGVGLILGLIITVYGYGAFL